MTLIQNEAWFFQELSPQQAEVLLQPLGEGAFVVRSYKKRLSISVQSKSVVHHLWLHQDEYGKCYVKREEKFKNILQMVLCYCRSTALGVQLQRYPSQEDVEAAMKLDASMLYLSAERDCNLTCYSLKFGRYGKQLVCAKNCRPHCGMIELTALRREARLLMSLSHANIVSLVGITLANVNNSAGFSAYTLVWEPGWEANLVYLLRENDCVFTQRFELAVQAAEAVLYLHNKGVVHNEVGAHNCFVSLANESDLRLKLGGFHFAHFEDACVDINFYQMLYRHHRLFETPPELKAIFNKHFSGNKKSSQHSSDKFEPNVPQAGPVEIQNLNVQTDLWAMGLLLVFLFGQLDRQQSHLHVSLNQSAEIPAVALTVLQQLVRSCLLETPQLRTSSFELTKQLKSLFIMCSDDGQEKQKTTLVTFDANKCEPLENMDNSKYSNQLSSHQWRGKNKSCVNEASSNSSRCGSTKYRSTSLLGGLRSLLRNKKARTRFELEDSDLENMSTTDETGVQQSLLMPEVISALPPSFEHLQPQVTPILHARASLTALAADASTSSYCDSSETLSSWEDQRAASEVNSTYIQQLVSYSKELRRKYTREQRSKMALKHEFENYRTATTATIEELEIKVVELESANKRLLQERSFINKAAEDQLFSMQQELEKFQDKSSTAHNHLQLQQQNQQCGVSHHGSSSTDSGIGICNISGVSCERKSFQVNDSTLSLPLSRQSRPYYRQQRSNSFALLPSDQKDAFNEQAILLNNDTLSKRSLISVLRTETVKCTDSKT